ncbi:MAG: rRNA maturation RNase YbeY [Sulfurovaceae bacterium]|nr:rRNA maturation RNase YbeY [Sulfurovaceae bacterium]
MIEIENQTQIQIDNSKLEEIGNKLSTKDIELILTDNETIQELNKEFRKKDTPTDVLSFPLEAVTPYEPAGSIVISLEYAKKVADDLGHTLDEEVLLLLIHGILHLQGYDHEIDKGEMREQENFWIKYFKLPESLIIRNDI